jgi:hypothetical protein
MDVMMKLMLTVAALAIAGVSARFLYDVKYPKPGTRPSFLRVLLVVPVSIVFVIAGIAGLMGIFATLGAF